FFAALELLLRAGVTTVAEAAFQDRLWRPGLEPLRGLARIRIVHCTIPAEVAFRRILRRGEQNPLRRVHTDRGRGAGASFLQRHGAFDGVGGAAPWMEVDPADGYRPGLARIASFLSEPG